MVSLFPLSDVFSLLEVSSLILSLVLLLVLSSLEASPSLEVSSSLFPLFEPSSVPVPESFSLLSAPSVLSLLSESLSVLELSLPSGKTVESESEDTVDIVLDAVGFVDVATIVGAID